MNIKIIFIITLNILLFRCKKYDENVLLITRPEVALYGYWESKNIKINKQNCNSDAIVKLKFPMEKNYGEYYGYFMIEDKNYNKIYLSNRFKYYSKNEIIPYCLYKKINFGTDTSILFQKSKIAKNLYYNLNQDFNVKIIFLNSRKMKIKLFDMFYNEYIIELDKIQSLW